PRRTLVPYTTLFRSGRSGVRNEKKPDGANSPPTLANPVRELIGWAPESRRGRQEQHPVPFWLDRGRGGQKRQGDAGGARQDPRIVLPISRSIFPGRQGRKACDTAARFAHREGALEPESRRAAQRRVAGCLVQPVEDMPE